MAKDAAVAGGAAARTDRLAPVPFRLKLGYGLGSLVDGVGTNAVNLFLLFYLDGDLRHDRRGGGGSRCPRV